MTTPDSQTRLAVILVLVVEAMMVGALAVLGGLLHTHTTWVPVSTPVPWMVVLGAGGMLSVGAALVPPRVGSALCAGSVLVAALAGVRLWHGAPTVDDWTATALVWMAVLIGLGLLGVWRLLREGAAWRPHAWLTACAWLAAAAVLLA